VAWLLFSAAFLAIGITKTPSEPRSGHRSRCSCPPSKELVVVGFIPGGDWLSPRVAVSILRDGRHHHLRPVLLAQLLETEGYGVRDAPDGLAALREIERAPPDLVLADIHMPGLGGLDLAARLDDRPEVIPVIFMSAEACALLDDALPCLAKPFGVETLLASIEAVLAAGEGVGYAG
jgi:CheY-like chemotaxis protein